jgi:hypothetical protein
MNKISEYSARFVSVALHPILMSTIGLLFIFNSGTYLAYLPFEAKRVIFYMFLSGTVVIPLCFIPIFIFFHLINNVKIESPAQRFFPILVTGILYFSTYLILRKFPIPFINLYLLSSATCVLINACIAPWWKISSHMIGAGGLTGLVLSLYFRLNADISGLLIISILISGIVGFARLRLSAHSQLQVYAGFFTGLILVFGMLLIL